jgi:hypothetical protein
MKVLEKEFTVAEVVHDITKISKGCMTIDMEKIGENAL